MSFADAYGADKGVHSTGHLGRKMRGRRHGGGLRRSFHQNDNMMAQLPQMPGKNIEQSEHMPPVEEYEDRPTRFGIQ